MAKFGRQVRPSTGTNEALFTGSNLPYRFVRPMCFVAPTGYATVKCYNRAGQLLWIGDQVQEGSGVAVDEDGNVYTSIVGGYQGTAYVDLNIVEKRSPTGVLLASVPMEKLSAPEIGIGRFKTTGARAIAVNSYGVYIIRMTTGDDGTSFTFRVDKWDHDLTTSSTLPQTNGSTSFTSTLSLLKIAARGTLVAAVAGATNTVTVAAWTNDSFNNVITTSALGSSGPVTGLEIDGSSAIHVSRGVGTNSYLIWSSSPSLTSSTGSTLISAMGITSFSVPCMYNVATPITGVTHKGNPVNSTTDRMGANESGEYVKSISATNPSYGYYDALDSQLWSDAWGNSTTDHFEEVVVTDSRVYICGKRVLLT